MIISGDNKPLVWEGLLPVVNMSDFVLTEMWITWAEIGLGTWSTQGAMLDLDNCDPDWSSARKSFHSWFCEQSHLNTALWARSDSAEMNEKLLRSRNRSLLFFALICTTIFPLIYLLFNLCFFFPLNLIKIVASFCNLQMTSAAKVTRFPDENTSSVSSYIQHVGY